MAEAKKAKTYECIRKCFFLDRVWLPRVNSNRDQDTFLTTDKKVDSKNFILWSGSGTPTLGKKPEADKPMALSEFKPDMDGLLV